MDPVVVIDRRGEIALVTLNRPDSLNAVNLDLGLAEMAALDPLKRGAADISFVAPHVDSLAGLGAYSTGDHGPEETVDIPSITRQATRAAILMSRLAAEKR